MWFCHRAPISLHCSIFLYLSFMMLLIREVTWTGVTGAIHHLAYAMHIATVLTVAAM